MSRIIGMPQGAISKVLCRVRETSRLAHEIPGHRLKTITSKENRAPLRVWDQGGADDAICMLCLSQCGAKTFSSRWISPKISRQMPQTNSWSPSTPLHIGTQAPDWNHPHWSHLIFADVFRVSLYICNGRARKFRHTAERLVDCWIQETRDQNGWDWPWTHQQISRDQYWWFHF